jgi:hypothetical protein
MPFYFPKRKNRGKKAKYSSVNHEQKEESEKENYFQTICRTI